MGLFKRNKVWWMNITHNGQRIRRSTETSSKKLAQEIEAKVRTLLVEGKYFDKLEGDSRPFKEVIDEYLKKHSLHFKGKRTHIRDKSIAKILNFYFGEKTLTSITSDMIENYQTESLENGKKPSTIKREIAVLSHVFTMAIKWKWARDNPVKDITKLKVNNLRVRYLTEEQVINLFDVLPHRLKPLVIIARETGLRKSNIINLRWNQVNLFAKAITVEDTKNGDILTVPLSDVAFKLLKEKSKVRQIDNSLIFFNRKGNAYDESWVSSQFKKSTIKAGIEDFHFHDLRHDFCSRLVQRGVDLYTVAKLAGHRDIKQTQRYAHLSPKKLQEAISVLNENVTNLSQEKRV